METSLKTQEGALKQQRQNQMDSLNPTMNASSHVLPTEGAHSQTTSARCPQTDAPNINKPQLATDMDLEKVINRIGSKFGLNRKQ